MLVDDFAPDVFDAVATVFVAAVFVVEGTIAGLDVPVPLMINALVVIITGMYVISVAASVSVVMPGWLASSPLKELVQTAYVVPAREQPK
jgi:hypothetical protein